MFFLVTKKLFFKNGFKYSINFYGMENILEQI